MNPAAIVSACRAPSQRRAAARWLHAGRRSPPACALCAAAPAPAETGGRHADAARATPRRRARGAQGGAGARQRRGRRRARSSRVEDARSIATLGRERQGSGVLIGDDGLVLTIGYLILEADHVDLVAGDGRHVPARVVAYDLASGFGLVQALAPLGLAPVPLGVSAAVAGDEPLLVASGGDERRPQPGAHGVAPRRSPATGNTTSTAPSSPRRRAPTTAAPASSTPTASSSASARWWSATPPAAAARRCAATCSCRSTC